MLRDLQENIIRLVEEFYDNPWKFIALDVIKISGLLFLLGIYSLSLSSGSAANGSYEYHWIGVGLMAAALGAARFGV